MWRQHFFSRGRPLVLSSPQSPGADMSPKKLSYPGAYNYINEERRERVIQYAQPDSPRAFLAVCLWRRPV